MPKNVSYSRGSFNYPILRGFETMQTDGHMYSDLPEKKVHDVWAGHIINDPCRTPHIQIWSRFIQGVWKLNWPVWSADPNSCSFLVVGSSEAPWVSQKTRGAQVLEFRFHRTYLPSLAGGKVLRSSI